MQTINQPITWQQLAAARRVEMLSLVCFSISQPADLLVDEPQQQETLTVFPVSCKQETEATSQPEPDDNSLDKHFTKEFGENYGSWIGLLSWISLASWPSFKPHSPAECCC